MTTPTGISTIVVTGQNLLDDGMNPMTGLVVFDAGAVRTDPASVPPTVFDNPATAEVINGVMSPVMLPDSHAFGTPFFTYTITLKFSGGTDAVYPGITITGSSPQDLASLL